MCKENCENCKFYARDIDDPYSSAKPFRCWNETSPWFCDMPALANVCDEFSQRDPT